MIGAERAIADAIAAGAVVFLAVTAVWVLGPRVADQTRHRARQAAVLARELHDWWQRRRRPVALEETRWHQFWARGGTDGWLRRQAWKRRFLRRHNRLRGWALNRLRAVRGVEWERDKQSAGNREFLQAKETGR